MIDNEIIESPTPSGLRETIPMNQPYSDESTSRFSSAPWYDIVQEQRVLLAGCGGIGSYVGFLLSRMKIRELVLYDPDVVEIGNLSGQLFLGRQAGINKVSAVRELAQSGSFYSNVSTNSMLYTQTSSTRPIMICGFDNMEARKVFFQNWEGVVEARPQEERENCLFIDGRLAAEEFQVLAITGDNSAAMESYKREYLFSDEEAEPTLCSYKQTSYMANMIASVIVNIFTNFCANKLAPPFPFETPFLTTYRADYMDFKVVRK